LASTLALALAGFFYLVERVAEYPLLSAPEQAAEGSANFSSLFQNCWQINNYFEEFIRNMRDYKIIPIFGKSMKRRKYLD
jgi:hypothetical protein